MNARQRKASVVLVIMFIGSILFLAWKFFYRPEPVHNGKPLSAWVEQWETNHWQSYSSAAAKQADEEATTAIHAIGNDGIPFLLQWMRARESALKKKLRTRVPRSWYARLHLEDRAGRLQGIGALGLAALGTNAGSAVPVLMELTSIQLVRDPPDRNNGYLPIFTLGFLGSAADPAVPLLIQCLTNRNDTLRLEAAHRLGQIGRRADIVVPALVAYLDSQKDANGNGERSAAIQSIGLFGTNASVAAPAFISLLKDRDISIRQAATNWLPYIDRAAAERAGVRSPSGN